MKYKVLSKCCIPPFLLLDTRELFLTLGDSVAIRTFVFYTSFRQYCYYAFVIRNYSPF